MREREYIIEIRETNVYAVSVYAESPEEAELAAFDKFFDGNGKLIDTRSDVKRTTTPS
jgi:hypothetical protein